MNIYRTRTDRISATRHTDITKAVRRLYRGIEQKTKRRPYIRAAYFSKEKVFFDYFWTHLDQKPAAERRRRLRYFPCAIELIQYTRYPPTAKADPNKPRDILYRFPGRTSNNDLFFVQIKEDTKTRKKYFISVFPAK